VFDAGDSDGSLHRMEFVDGRTLAQELSAADGSSLSAIT